MSQSGGFSKPQGMRPPVLIFVQSIERAKELFRELVYDGINVDVIHSERTQTQVRCLTISLIFFRIPFFFVLLKIAL